MPEWMQAGKEANSSTRLGTAAEQAAEEYLVNKGLTLFTRNYRCRQGEIDLIMLDGNFLVFIEVRYRKNNRFGSAADSVTRQKQERLIKTANHYLQNEKQGADRPCRFDVITLSRQKNQEIHWIENAFQL